MSHVIYVDFKPKSPQRPGTLELAAGNPLPIYEKKSTYACNDIYYYLILGIITELSRIIIIQDQTGCPANEEVDMMIGHLENMLEEL